MRSDLPIGRQVATFNAKASRSQGPRQSSLGGMAPVYKGLLPQNLSPAERVRKEALSLLDRILFALEEMNLHGKHEITVELYELFKQVGIEAPNRYGRQSDGGMGGDGRWPQNRTVRLIEVVWELQKKFLLQPAKEKLTRAKRSDEFKDAARIRAKEQHAERKRKGVVYTQEQRDAISEKIRETIRRKSLARVRKVEEEEIAKNRIDVNIVSDITFGTSPGAEHENEYTE